jgi:hypothetical protein
MRKTAARHNRKLLVAVPLVWCAIAGLQAAASADDGGQADAGTDASLVVTPGGSGSCSVAGSSMPFGAGLGAGCC